MPTKLAVDSCEDLHQQPLSAAVGMGTKQQWSNLHLQLWKTTRSDAISLSSFIAVGSSTPSGGYVTILSAWPFTAHCVRCANTGSGAIVVERIVPHAPSIEAPTIPSNCKRTREGKLRKTTNTAIKLENVLENLIKLILYYL